MADLEVLQDAAVLIDGERIAWVGPRSEARDLHSAFRIPQSAIDVVEVAAGLGGARGRPSGGTRGGAPNSRARRGVYAGGVGEEMIPAVARQHLATACDVFCEPGVFDIAETRTILTAAQRHGLGLKLHADELEGAGGAELAAALGALSADHLAAIFAAPIRALASSDTVAVLLPATMVFLGRRAQAPARRLVAAGAAVALATDFNPGSSPTVGLPLVMALGVSQLGLRHAEVVSAVTVNAAAALGLAADRGQIASGFRADLVSWSVSDWRGGGKLGGGELGTPLLARR